ncbi:MAG: hypothetical protein IE913_09540 [Halothiobacillus sp.]|nr:hypothetical protein [Halothiobacillus sp.]
MSKKIIQTTPDIGIKIKLQRLMPNEAATATSCKYKLMWLVRCGEWFTQYTPCIGEFIIDCVKARFSPGYRLPISNRTRCVIWGTTRDDEVEWLLANNGSDTSITAQDFDDLGAHSAYFNWSENTPSGIYIIGATINGVRLEDDIQIIITNDDPGNLFPPPY